MNQFDYFKKKDEYDFTLSFAGEDREIVEIVRNVIKTNGLKVFYDRDEQHNLLGKDLAEYFSDLYQKRARYCVVFISHAYMNKPWCKWERRSALARAFKSESEYIIPYYIDSDCDIPSIPDTIGRADMKDTSPVDFARYLVKKYYSDINKLENVYCANNLKQEIQTGLSENEFQVFQSMLTSKDVFFRNEKNNKSGITTGMSRLDKKLKDYLRAGSVYMVAARPGMGKTMFALNIIHSNICKGKRCAYVCLEETASHLIFNLLGMQASIPSIKLRSGFLNDSEWDKLAKAVYELEKAPLYLLERGDLSFDKIMCELWDIIWEGRARFIVIDSLDLILQGSFFGTDISMGPQRMLRSLKWLARETNTTIMVVNGLSRSVEKRESHIPQISDLFGGKRLKEDLEAIFLLHRNGYYNPNSDSAELLVYIVRENGYILTPVQLFFFPEKCKIICDDNQLMDEYYGDATEEYLKQKADELSPGEEEAYWEEEQEPEEHQEEILPDGQLEYYTEDRNNILIKEKNP